MQDAFAKKLRNCLEKGAKVGFPSTKIEAYYIMKLPLSEKHCLQGLNLTFKYFDLSYI